MKAFSRLAFVLAACAISPFVGQVQAQDQQPDSKYDQHEVFDPGFFTQSGNMYRSANGAPGPAYWQNKVNYEIHATLNEPDTTLSGEVKIHYLNNSPDSLHYLWLQLDQNLFEPSSRGAATTPISGDRFDVKGYTQGGEHIHEVEVTYKGKTYKIEPVISDARMQLRLPVTIAPKGDAIDVRVNYSFSIPRYGADRMGRLYTKNGVVYELAQWYPRMCVYDDIKGWNTLPYMGLGEFYLEYGDFDYYVTVPATMIVAGSGVLQNPQDVLTKTQQQRLKKAAGSDSTVMIVQESEIGSPLARPSTKGNLTWHFKMKNSRDIAWSASNAFIWDAARVNYPSGRKGLASAVYPVESKGVHRYGRAAQYLKQSIEFYSKHYFEFPWDNATAVAGVALGMEYPGIVFCMYNIEDGNLFHDVTHEIGHNWFPMIVGSNERRFMWMDEGMNTFINSFASNWFNGGEYGDTTNKDIMHIARVLKTSTSPLITAPENIGLGDYGQYYFKTAAGLKILRNVVLGHDRFDYAFKQYVHDWAFKHPQPEDFFRSMNNAAGEDLNWFWKAWVYKTWQLDQAVTEVRQASNNLEDGCLITILNKEKMALPVLVRVTEQNGKVTDIKLPVEVWQRGASWTFKVNTTSAVTKVELDPESDLPDGDRTNNVWTK